MSKISKQELIKLQKSLVTDKAIGRKFNISKQAVHQARKRYGIESRFADNPSRNARVVAAYKKGLSVVDIAKKFDLSISSSYRIINEAGALKKSR